MGQMVELFQTTELAERNIEIYENHGYSQKNHLTVVTYQKMITFALSLQSTASGHQILTTGKCFICIRYDIVHPASAFPAYFK